MLAASTIEDLLPELAPDKPLDVRTQACDSLLQLLAPTSTNSLASLEILQILRSVSTFLQLQPDQIPASAMKAFQLLAATPAAAKAIIRSPSLDRLAALLRQGDADMQLSILILLDALAGHRQHLSEFAKSNVIFELLAILEDLKPKSAGKRRAASQTLVSIFNAPACCEQVG